MKRWQLNQRFGSMLLMILFIAVQLPAQTIAPVDNIDTPSIVFDLSTFTGIVAAISLIVTQVAKVIPVIGVNRVLKIASSLVVGVIVSLLSHWFGVASFLIELPIWQVVTQGLFAGLMACGIYDIIKPLFGKKD